MTTNQMKKNALANYPRWATSTDTELYHVYGSYSHAKASSYESIRDEMHKCGGHDLRIISHNCMMYTCGYLRNNPKTGFTEFVYHTATYSTVVTIEDREVSDR